MSTRLEIVWPYRLSRSLQTTLKRVHTGGHLGEYYNGFFDHIETIKETRLDAVLAGDRHALDEVVSDLNDLVDAAKYAQANGHLFANTPKGMTPQEANERNKKWFDNWRKYAFDNEVQIRQMRETVDQLYGTGQKDAAEHWPLLSPTSNLSLAERDEILRQHFKGRYANRSLITLQSTAVGAVPTLQGLVPPTVDSHLPGLSPPPIEVLKPSEGFTPSNPLPTYGAPGFPVSNPASLGLGQLPPSAAVPQLPQVLQFHSEIGDLLRQSNGSPLMGPDPYNMPHDPADDPANLRGLAMFGAVTSAPLWLPSLPAWAPIAGALGLAGAAVNSAALADPADKIENEASAAAASDLAAGQVVNGSIDQGLMRANTFVDRFGNWTDTPAGTMPASSGRDAAVTPAAQAAAPNDVRRLTRVNESNAGSVFTTGSAPVPYLPSTGFNDRFGNWRTPTGDGGAQQASRPISAFADEPSYFIPPSIFGSHDSSSDADEWFSRWIRPLLRQD